MKHISSLTVFLLIKTFILCFVFLSVFHQASAHPGIGLVMDSKGNIYYTDLKQIWKQTPAGEKTIAVPSVHSHELYIDKYGNLFGEHLWYEPAKDKFFNYQWCLKSTGELTKVTATLEAYTQTKSYSFTRDDNGNMYWYEATKNGSVHFIRQDTTGNKNEIASGIFRDIRWVFSTPQGEIYFLDLDDLYKITPDSKFQLIAKNLCTGSAGTAFSGKRHSVFGVWFDNTGNIFAAVTADRCIRKVLPTGNVIVVYKSKKGAPVNGLFDKEGNLWVLENERVKKVELAEVSKGQAWFSNNSKYLFVLIGCVIIPLFIRQLIKKNTMHQR